MAHDEDDDPSIINNAGRAERVLIAIKALVAIVKGDERVQRAVAAILDALADRGDDSSERAQLDHLVRVEMGLDYAWLPSHLFADLASDLAAATMGWNVRFMVELPTVVEELPRGRGAKGDGDHIPRDVEWFYRARVKRPVDSIRSLAKEYAKSLAQDRIVMRSKKTDYRSVVQKGITRAKKLLSTVPDALPYPLPK